MGIPYRPRRIASQLAIEGAGAGLYPAVGLYDDSSGAELLIVRSLRVLGGGGVGVELSHLAGHLAAGTGVRGVSMVAGEASLPGLLEQTALAALPTADYVIIPGAAGDAWWPHDYPVRVVQPNETLRIVGTQTGTNLIIAISWQSIYPEELERFEKLTGSDW